MIWSVVSVLPVPPLVDVAPPDEAGVSEVFGGVSDVFAPFRH